MYANEHDANAFGFRSSNVNERALAHLRAGSRTRHERAYPVACRLGFKLALVLSIGFGAIVRLA